MDLEIVRGATPDEYRVQVVQSPAGEGSGVIPLTAERFLAHRQGLQQVLLASAVARRRLVSDSERLVRDVGHELFTALFSSPAVSGLYRASCAVAEERGHPLRIVLRVNPPELAALPWEAMYDSLAGSYVCRREPLVRYVPVASAAPPLRVELPLRILAIVSSPRGLPPLDVEKEREDLTQALADAIRVGAVELQWAESATWGALQDLLMSREWHVLHFIGHGDFDSDRDEGVLALVGGDGRINRVEAGRFVDLLREASPMPRLVVLNSCVSAKSGARDLFSGTAACLVRGGVSAVAAMQFEISDAAAIEFCRGFYTAIARGRGVDEAVRSGRVAILGTSGATLEWITPVLYLRSLDARLFTVDPTPPDPVTSRPNLTVSHPTRVAGETVGRESADADSAAIEKKYSEAVAAYGKGDYASAVTIFDSVLASRPNYRDVALRRDDAILKLRVNDVYMRARAAEHAKDWSAAVSAYQAVLDLDPNLEDAAARRDACRYRLATDSSQSSVTARPEGQSSSDPSADLPKEAQAAPGPERQIERDPLERLWQHAKETAWDDRPGKSTLAPLTAFLTPNESVVGICRLPFRWLTECALTITNRTLYLSSEKENEYWSRLLASTPARFHASGLVISVPITAIEGCSITDGIFFLQIWDEPRITFKVFQPRSKKILIDRFINASGMNSTSS